MNETINENVAIAELNKGFDNAEKILKDEQKMERFLQKLEKKLKVIPLAGDTLAMVPIMISLIKSYIDKEYTEIPLGTIIAVISALAYVISPTDIVPDFIPGAGYIDDAAVVAACLKLVGSDIEEYQEWRKKNNKLLDV